MATRRRDEFPPAPVPPRPTLPRLRAAAAGCRACPLWKCGTQTVFGEGDAHAGLMLLGEQPGNDEDLAGRPFVGPAGRLLGTLLVEAGLDRREAYLTNAVKHFKWEAQPGTKRRLHKKPGSREIAACSPWLAAELAVVKPHVLVCLGATAAQAVLGRDFRVSVMRGQWVESPVARKVMATLHPSAVLRAPDPAARRELRGTLLGDLRKAILELRSLQGFGLDARF